MSHPTKTEPVIAGSRDIAVWQFNEAVSLLREARLYVPDEVALAKEIDEGLPVIQAALETAAALQRDPSGVYIDLHEELDMANARLKEATELLRRWKGCAPAHWLYELRRETEEWL